MCLHSSPFWSHHQCCIQPCHWPNSPSLYQNRHQSGKHNCGNGMGMAWECVMSKSALKKPHFEADSEEAPRPWLLWAWSLSPSSSPKSSKTTDITRCISHQGMSSISSIQSLYNYIIYYDQTDSNMYHHSIFFQVLKPYKKNTGVVGCYRCEKNTSPRWEAIKTHRTSTCERCCFFSSTWSDEKASVAK